MPRGVRRVIEQAGNADVTQVMEAEKVVRSRDEVEADRVTEEFLKRNRPNIAGFEQRLAYFGERPGWVRRWVNDQHNRIPSMLERGWRFVTRETVHMSDSVGHGNTDIGDKVSVSTTVGEGPMRTYLMEIPKKLFDMQVDAAMEPVRKTEAAIKAGRTGIEDSEHVYTPDWAPTRIETKLQ